LEDAKKKENKFFEGFAEKNEPVLIIFSTYFFLKKKGGKAHF